MTEHDTAEELERYKREKEAEANMAIYEAEELRLAKQELKLGAKHRSLQRNCSIAARVNSTKPKGYRARADLRSKFR
jgi:hypothetical protein